MPLHLDSNESEAAGGNFELQILRRPLRPSEHRWGMLPSPGFKQRARARRRSQVCAPRLVSPACPKLGSGAAIDERPRSIGTGNRTSSTA